MDEPVQRSSSQRRHPQWLKVRAPFGEQVQKLKRLMSGRHLNTVCQEAMCPNMGECWSHGVATFMILGDTCTRGCRYCAVDKGRPAVLDPEEPRNVAEAVRTMGLKHVVVTSVDRDDLADGGAGAFAATVREIRRLNSGCLVEVLIPDFQGSESALETLLGSGPDIIGHNIETVPRLYPLARGGGNYQRSLQLLRRARILAPDLPTKTGIMLGLGEEREEVRQVLQDLLESGVNILTVGQYLRPTGWHLPVARFYHPDEFREWKDLGERMGFGHVESGPLVRSSYLADRQFSAFQRKVD